MVSLSSTWEKSRHLLKSLLIRTYLWRAAQPQHDRLPVWKHRTEHAASSLHESPALAAAGRSTPLHWMPRTAGRVKTINFSYDMQLPIGVKTPPGLTCRCLLKKLSSMHLLHQLFRARYHPELGPSLAKINSNIPAPSGVMSYSITVKIHIFSYHRCSH